MMSYIRAYCPIHVALVRDMVPHFFAASDQNYARHGLYYLRNVEPLPEDTHDCFLSREDTVHHFPCVLMAYVATWP